MNTAQSGCGQGSFRVGADGEQRGCLPAGRPGEEVIALVVDDDECREIAYLDLPDRFHAEFGVLNYFDLGDAVLGQPGGGAADRAEVEAAVLGTGPGDRG